MCLLESETLHRDSPTASALISLIVYSVKIVIIFFSAVRDISLLKEKLAKKFDFLAFFIHERNGGLI